MHFSLTAAAFPKNTSVLPSLRWPSDPGIKPEMRARLCPRPQGCHLSASSSRLRLLRSHPLAHPRPSLGGCSLAPPLTHHGGRAHLSLGSPGTERGAEAEPTACLGVQSPVWLVGIFGGQWFGDAWLRWPHVLPEASCVGRGESTMREERGRLQL